MIDSERGFLDTAFFIYHLENNRRYAPITTSILKFADINKKVLCTSVVSVSEFLIKPYAKGDTKAVEQFNLFLFDFPILTFHIDYRIADRAAQLRSRYSFLKGLDSLQLAAAIEEQCDAFITNDKKLKAVKEIRVVFLNDLLL